MTAFTASSPFQDHSSSQANQAHTALLNGEILLCTQPHSAWGGAVTAQMYLPKERSHVWQEITNYARWVHFFPDLVQSEVVNKSEEGERTSKRKRLYQVARKAFFLLSVQVEIYLNVIETIHHNTRQQIQFVMERGSFQDFSAHLQLQDYEQGTLLTYSVKATPSIPVPSALIQEAMKLDLPSNMKQMRQVICGSAG